ncbi:MAG: hypothetical protein U5K69_04050 [Balneolaceae bacterium]|nr:hypothetical protein [Balneolaceae bacterium]
MSVPLTDSARKISTKGYQHITGYRWDNIFNIGNQKEDQVECLPEARLWIH